MTISIKPFAAAAFAFPFVAMAAPAASSAADTDAKIQALEQQLDALKAQIADLKNDQAQKYDDVKQQYAEVKNHYEADKAERAKDGKVSMKNGRPTFSSADGKFTASIRANVQADYAYYMQPKKATSSGIDLSSGAVVRRAQLGVSGKVFGDWSYNFLYDFGGAGTETPGKILYAYAQYDGLAPFAVRIGAFAPAYDVEDQTSSASLMFLERNTPTNMLRGVAGSEGRLGLGLIYGGDRFYGSLAYAMGKIAGSGEYDEQMALVGRASYLVVDNKAEDAHLLLGGGFSHIFKMADKEAGSNTLHSLTLKDMPELRVDDTATNLINTGAMGADHFTAWNAQIAGNYQNFYLQAAYNGIFVDRAASQYSVYTSSSESSVIDVIPDHNSHFHAWYAQGSWILTGESKSYIKSTGAFDKPHPAHPFSLSQGYLGAWELAARYSMTDLNSHADDPTSIITGWTSSGTQTYTFVNAVRGGEQRNLTFGLNWYPNDAVRFDLDYMLIDIDRLQATSNSSTPSTTSLGETIQAVALRAQVAF